MTRPAVSVAGARQPPIRSEAFRLGPGGQQDQQGVGDLDEVQPAQQDGATALPHGTQAIDHLKIAEQGLDAPAVGVRLDDGRSGQRGIGGQQQARPGPAAARLFQLAPDHPHDDAPQETRATHGVAQPGRPAAIAGNGVDRGR